MFPSYLLCMALTPRPHHRTSQVHNVMPYKGTSRMVDRPNTLPSSTYFRTVDTMPFDFGSVEIDEPAGCSSLLDASRPPTSSVVVKGCGDFP